MTTYSTLSPIPQLRNWARAAAEEGALNSDYLFEEGEFAGEEDPVRAFLDVMEGEGWRDGEAVRKEVRGPLERLAAFYLVGEKRNGKVREGGLLDRPMLLFSNITNRYAVGHDSRCAAWRSSTSQTALPFTA